MLRPSTWTAPAAPGEVIGERARRARVAPAVAGPTPSDGSVEAVTIDTDDDLNRFVGALISRLAEPAERHAIRAGRVRFTLRRSPAGMPGTGTIRNGAATATVESQGRGHRAHGRARRPTTGGRLVLARGAVLTPLAREKARALGVEIEREGKC